MCALATADIKRATMDKTIKIGDQEYRINTDKSKGQGCFVEILRATESNLTAMLSYHCKVLVVQFVVHCYEYEPKNHGVSDLMRVVKKRLSSKYRRCRVAGGWVRETGKSGIQHYHVALFIDGNKVRWNSGIQDLINEILDTRNYPRSSFSPSHMVHRDDEDGLRKAFYHLSYLAKTRSKWARLPSTNDYSFSRIRPKMCAIF